MSVGCIKDKVILFIYLFLAILGKSGCKTKSTMLPLNEGLFLDGTQIEQDVEVIRIASLTKGS